VIKPLIYWFEYWHKIKKQFKIKHYYSNAIFEFSEDGIKFNNGYDNLLLECVYELVQESVDRLTAIEANDNGKTISCQLPNVGKRIFKQTVGKFLVDDDGLAVTTQEILNGTWYIEEE
jgi:hypothetical protein